MSKDNNLFDNKNHTKIDSHGSFLSEYSILNEKMVSIFDRSLAEAVQGIALSSDISSAVYLNFIVFHHVAILEQV